RRRPSKGIQKPLAFTGGTQLGSRQQLATSDAELGAGLFDTGSGDCYIHVVRQRLLHHAAEREIAETSPPGRTLLTGDTLVSTAPCTRRNDCCSHRRIRPLPHTPGEHRC